MKNREPAVHVETINDARVLLAIGDTTREMHYRQAGELAARIQEVADSARRGTPNGAQLRAVRNQTAARHYPARTSVRLTLGPYYADLDVDVARRLADNLHDSADALEAQQQEPEEAGQ